jgi:hypothetical protein
MNGITKFGVSAVMAASIAAGGVAIAGTTAASAATSPAVVSACSTSVSNHAFPKRATTYRAGSAGLVTVAPVNSTTIRVAAVHPAAGWRYFIDTGRGSSVDVYFRGGTHSVKFEAEINDWGGLTTTVTNC